MLSIVSAEISIKIMIIQDIIHISFKYNISITYHFYLYVKDMTSMFKDVAMQFGLPISAISILDKNKYNIYQFSVLILPQLCSFEEKKL